MEVITGYKNSDIGFIPLDWDVKELHEIAKISRGRFSPRPRNNPIYYGGVIPFVQTGDVTRCNGVIKNYTQTLNELGLSVSILYKKGTILMTIAANIGYAGILEMDMACPDSLVAIDGIPGVNNRFLNFWFNYRRQKIEDLSTSGAQKNLNIELLSPFKVPVPDFEEQTAIATALSDTDALISSLEKLIAKKRSIKQGAIQELLKPKKGWVMKTYGEVFDFLSTANYSRSELSSNDNIMYVHYGDIHTKWNDFLDMNESILPTISQIQSNGYSLVKEGDLIMADASEDYDGVGKSVEVKNLNSAKVIAGLHTFLLRDQGGFFVDGFKGYIHLFPIVKNQLNRLATGLKVYGISKSNLKLVQIPVPKREEQIEIAKVLNDMEAEIACLQSKLTKYRQIKSGMMQSLLTGKIRLV